MDLQTVRLQQKITCHSGYVAAMDTNTCWLQGFTSDFLRLSSSCWPFAQQALRESPWETARFPRAYLRETVRTNLFQVFGVERPEPPENTDLAEIEPLLELEKACARCGMSLDAKGIILARFQCPDLSVREAGGSIGLSPREIETRKKELLRVRAHLKKIAE